MKRVSKLVFLGGLLAAWATGCLAWFEVEHPAPGEITAAMGPGGVPSIRYRTAGHGGDGTGVVRGFASDEALEKALGKILPDGWSAIIDDRLRGKHVAWAGGLPWKDVLRQMGERFRLKFSFDDGRREVMVDPGSRPALPAIADPTKKVDAVRQWKVVKGERVRETLERWAKEAGWNGVAWLPPWDYVQQAPATFSGDFRKAAGDMISVWAKAGAPIGIRFSKNRYVRVIQIK